MISSKFVYFFRYPNVRGVSPPYPTNSILKWTWVPLTLAELIAAPKPVANPQPIMHAFSRRASSSTLATEISFMTVYSEKVPVVIYWYVVFPLQVILLLPSDVRCVPESLFIGERKQTLCCIKKLESFQVKLN